VMAFLGVTLGVFAKAALVQGLFASSGYLEAGSLDPEMGLPLFLATVLPTGLMGLMMAAYFSAVLSTADSCLMAASGNLVADIIKPFKKMQEHTELKISQFVTLILGTVAVLLASTMQNVLELMLMSYAFMVSGLLVPVIAGFLVKQPSANAALFSMIAGGSVTLILIILKIKLPWNLDANVFGLTSSAIVYLIAHKLDMARITNNQ
jgi:solute:Na+ symporter, SSS family